MSGGAAEWLAEWPGSRPRVIGMLHLPPLAGAPRYGGCPRAPVDAVLRDAEVLVEGGVDALLLENFGDAPFYPGRVPAWVAAQMTAAACAVRRRFDRPLGINVLRNDPLTALAVAHAAGAAFIRVNVLCGARLTDQGLIQGPAHELLRLRRELGAETIRILADVAVKHSAPLAPRSVLEEAEETLHRALADGLIISGPATGRPPQAEQVAALRPLCGPAPLLIGSGVDADNARAFQPHADGLIVGSALQRDGRAGQPVETHRLTRFLASLGR